MILTYRTATSSPRMLPGSTPQGAFLGIFLFVIKFNGASLRPNISRLSWTQPSCNLKRSKCSTLACEKHARDAHFLYVDDLSEAEAVNLKQQLKSIQSSGPQRLNLLPFMKELSIASHPKTVCYSRT